MAEHATLFRGQLVRNILDLLKTDTRRLFTASTCQKIAGVSLDDLDWRAHVLTGPRSTPHGPRCAGRVCCGIVMQGDPRVDGESMWVPDLEGRARHHVRSRIVPGDILWVRETWGAVAESLARPANFDTGEGCTVLYRATDGDPDPDEWENWKWRPSIHMPKWASRIRLRVTSVHPERVTEITHAGALREGVQPDKPGGCARVPFARLWDEIYGKPGTAWADDPWVWVIKFTIAEVRR